MNKSKVTYKADGTTKAFTVSMPYLRQKHIIVEVNGVQKPYRWLNDTKIELATAPVSGAFVTIIRQTPTEPLYKVENNRPIPAFYINELAQQAIYVAEENRGERGEGFKINAVGSLSERKNYDNKPEGFTFFSSDEGALYVRYGKTGWSSALPFIKQEYIKPDWNNIQNKPSRFQPAVHTHSGFYTKEQSDQKYCTKQEIDKQLQELNAKLYDNAVPGLNRKPDGELLYTKSGKILWPSWVTDATTVCIQAWGGGGGGGGSYTPALGGGGGGGGCTVWYGHKRTLNSLDSIIIGAGGYGAKIGNYGNNGGTTYVGGTFLFAYGGSGGYPASNTKGLLTGGAGGKGGQGMTLGLPAPNNLQLPKGGNGADGGKGGGTNAPNATMPFFSGTGGNGGGDVTLGSAGSAPVVRYYNYLPGRAGLGFGGGGAGGVYDAAEEGRGADGAVRVLLWK